MKNWRNGLLLGCLLSAMGTISLAAQMAVADSASVGLETGSKYGNCLHTKAAEELIPYMLGPMKGMRARLHEAIPRKDIPEVSQVYQLRKPNTFFPSGFVGRVVSVRKVKGCCVVSFKPLRKYRKKDLIQN